MEQQRNPIRVSMKLIHKMSEEDSGLSIKALAFAVMIKRNLVSSVFKDATITNLMSAFHLKHGNLKKVLNEALRLGFVSYVVLPTKGGGKLTCLKANKLYERGESTIKFNVCDTKNGRMAYIKTNYKRLEEEHQNAETFQSINDVVDLLITARLLALIKRHNRMLNCQLRQACVERYSKNGLKLFKGANKTYELYVRLYREMQEEMPVGEINGLNCGYAMDTMLQSFGKFFTRYKLRKLLHKNDQQHNHLFMTVENKVMVDQTERLNAGIREERVEKPVTLGKAPLKDIVKAWEDMDYNLRAKQHNGKTKWNNYQDRFNDINENGEPIHLYKDRGCYISKECKTCLVMQMANTYFLQCEPFVTTGKKHRRVKKSTTPNEAAQTAPKSVSSNQNHVNINELPY